MAAENIVFFPKYTTLVEGTYYSDPYDVTGYKTLTAETLLTALIASGTISVQIQMSSDLITWVDTGTPMAPVSAGSSAAVVISDPVRYVRAVATIGGAGSGVVTFWTKGVARDS